MENIAFFFCHFPPNIKIYTSWSLLILPLHISIFVHSRRYCGIQFVHTHPKNGRQSPYCSITQIKQNSSFGLIIKLGKDKKGYRLPKKKVNKLDIVDLIFIYWSIPYEPFSHNKFHISLHLIVVEYSPLQFDCPLFNTENIKTITKY